MGFCCHVLLEDAVCAAGGLGQLITYTLLLHYRTSSTGFLMSVLNARRYDLLQSIIVSVFVCKLARYSSSLAQASSVLCLHTHGYVHV